MKLTFFMGVTPLGQIRSRCNSRSFCAAICAVSRCSLSGFLPMPADRPRLPILAGGCEGYSFQQLQGDEVLAFKLVDLINRADVGVVQRRSRARLAFEALSASESFASASGRNLSATLRPSLMSSGLVHTPMPPPPSFSMMR